MDRHRSLPASAAWRLLGADDLAKLVRPLRHPEAESPTCVAAVRHEAAESALEQQRGVLVP